LCRIEKDQWARVGRLHIGQGFETMADAVEYAEHPNWQRWPSFDWLKAPAEAFLAFRD
jgi:hypothetical protein